MHRKVDRSVLSKISVLFLISGILSLTISVYIVSQVLAFIGLGLTFWGALFLLLKPVNFVEGSLLYNATVSAYLTIERIIDEFDPKGKGYYIPPYPKDVYLPEYLKSLKDSVVFISDEENSTMPSIEEMAKGKFMSRKPKGVLITPPGLGILTHIEENSKVDFTKIKLNELDEVLPNIVLRDLNLAKEMAMELNGDQVHLHIVDSLYKYLHNVQNSLKSVAVVGDPIASAVACAVAKASGRAVTIKKQQISPDGSAISVWFTIVKG